MILNDGVRSAALGQVIADQGPTATAVLGL